jgi:hypothetical protein
MSGIHVASQVNSRDKSPGVMLRVNEDFVILTPADARKVAADLLEAAQAAIGDAFIYNFLQSHGFSVGQSVAAIQALRDYRQGLEKSAGAEEAEEAEEQE